MTKKIVFAIFILLLFSCSQKNNEKYTYYESGRIKTKIIYKANEETIAYLFSEDGKLQKYAEKKNNLFNGVSRSYFDNGSLSDEIEFKNGKKNGRMLIYDSVGRIHMTRSFLNDTIHGITKVFNVKGEIKQEYLYIKGKEVLFNQYVDSKGGSMNGFLNYILHNNPKLKESGRIIYDKNNIPQKNFSFYYVLNKEKDTININETNKINIEFVNKFNWQLEVQLGKMDTSLNFISKSEVYRSLDNKINFFVRADRKGWNLLTGKLSVTSLDKERSNAKNEFIFYCEFFAKD